MKKIRPMNDTVREMPLLTLGMNKVSLPSKAQVLSVGYDQEETLQLTVILDEGRDRFQDRGFYVAAKGMRMPSGVTLTYLGSPRRPGHRAVHVFEIDSPEGRPEARVSAMRGAVVANTTDNVAPGATVVQAGSIRGGLHDRAVSIQ